MLSGRSSKYAVSCTSWAFITRSGAPGEQGMRWGAGVRKAVPVIQHKHGLTPRLLKECKKGNRVERCESSNKDLGGSLLSWLSLEPAFILG